MSKSILVVAADRGLGLGLAREFFQRGWAVTATTRAHADITGLTKVGSDDPTRLSVAQVDVTVAEQIDPFLKQLGDQQFGVIYINAGIWGAEHQSVVEATNDEFADVMLTNAFGPVRLAHRLLEYLAPDGALCFMASHLGSVELNQDGGTELYRASKAALNILARGVWASNRERHLTVLSIHPGWAKTDMGTLGGTIEAEIDVGPSVSGIGDVVEANMGSGEHRYLTWQGQGLPW